MNDTTRARYLGADGHTGSTLVRGGSSVPDYTTAKGTAGHYLVNPDLTGGTFSMYRWDMSAQSAGPSPHFHRTYDETFYVLSGSVHMYEGTAWFDARPGDVLHVPAGGIHAFTNTSGAPASMLMLLTPGIDRARYFDELAAYAARGTGPTDAELADLHLRHDNTMVGD